MARSHEPGSCVALHRLVNRQLSVYETTTTAMEALLSSSSSLLPTAKSRLYCPKVKATLHFPLKRNCINTSTAQTARRTRLRATINDVQTVLDPAPVQVTWQIVVGTIGIMFGINS